MPALSRFLKSDARSEPAFNQRVKQAAIPSFDGYFIRGSLSFEFSRAGG
jgi:hypothetical protein